MRIRIVLMLLTLNVGIGAVAQQKPAIKMTNAKPTSPSSGAEMYRAYCASCHGPEGAGNGPAAKAFKVAPSNLTTLARANGGQYPAAKVQQTIIGDTSLLAHGSKDMPVWGPVFSSVSPSRAQVQLRAANLSKYIETLQAK